MWLEHGGVRAPGSGGSKQTRFGHSPLTKSKGREMNSGETSQGFISVRLTLGRWQTSLSGTASKMPKNTGLYIRKMWSKAGQVHAG